MRGLYFALLCCAAVALSGCGEKQAHTRPWMVLSKRTVTDGGKTVYLLDMAYTWETDKESFDYYQIGQVYDPVGRPVRTDYDTTSATALERR